MLKKRREIDGLRAVAVLPVMLFHAGFSTFSGGFVGVDVFFVISGYLITTIIVEERLAGNFTLLGFYERRARRILPALYLVILCCLPFAWLWMTPDQTELFGWSVIAVSLFAANILFWRQTGYFAGPAEEMPLLHTWSLAVEEQFYLLFPVFVLLAWRIGLRNLAISIGILAAISLGIAEWGWRFKPIANFYLLPTRAWELLIGSMAAIYLIRRPLTFSHWNQPASLFGLGLVLYAVIVFDSRTPFPSLLALVPVIGTVLIILFATPETLVGRLLSLTPFVGIGLVSYSAYLWHQPLFAFARLRSIDEPDTPLMLVLIALALSLAWVSWRFVENPFRDKGRISRTGVFAAAPLMAMLLVAVGLFGTDRDRLVDLYPEYQRVLVEVSSGERVAYVMHRYDKEVKDKPFPAYGLKLLLIGDSFSQDFYNVIRESNAFPDYAISAILVPGPCQMAWEFSDLPENIGITGLKRCQSHLLNEGIRQHALEADIVIFAFNWHEHVVKSLPSRIAKFDFRTDQTVLVLGRKQFGNERMSIGRLLRLSEDELLGLSLHSSDEHLRINQAMRSSLPKSIFVDVHDIVCGRSGACPIFTPTNHELISHDGGHLTPDGAEYLGTLLFRHELLKQYAAAERIGVPQDGYDAGR